MALSGCIRHQENFFQAKNQKKIIALQPFGDYNMNQLNFISKEISSFYNRKVIILKPIDIQATFRLINDVELYSADSILNLLSGVLNDDIIEVVGLTHKNIYILNQETNKTKDPLFDNSVQDIFGFGDFPGNYSVISDYLFKTKDTIIFKHRLRTVIFHEMGHNLGLDHCMVKQCIMSGKNGKISFLDKCGNDYCHHCKRKLQN